MLSSPISQAPPSSIIETREPSSSSTWEAIVGLTRPERLAEGRSDFYNWFNELDRRRNTNFDQTFPEYKDFKEQCRMISETQK